MYPLPHRPRRRYLLESLISQSETDVELMQVQTLTNILSLKCYYFYTLSAPTSNFFFNETTHTKDRKW
jgi:hypothetical protein